MPIHGDDAESPAWRRLPERKTIASTQAPDRDRADQRVEEFMPRPPRVKLKLAVYASRTLKLCDHSGLARFPAPQTAPGAAPAPYRYLSDNSVTSPAKSNRALGTSNALQDKWFHGVFEPPGFGTDGGVRGDNRQARRSAARAGTSSNSFGVLGTDVPHRGPCKGPTE